MMQGHYVSHYLLQGQSLAYLPLHKGVFKLLHGADLRKDPCHAKPLVSSGLVGFNWQ